MKIISWNVNGIRAVYEKGFLDWLKKADADIVCLQEIKAGQKQVPQEILDLPGYFKYFNPAEKPGYSGTAALCRKKPISVENRVGESRLDKEGRVMKLRFKDFTLFNLYMINGGGSSQAASEKNMADKLASYDYFIDFLAESESRPLILVGDFNVAHQEIDLARPNENAKNHGFTLPERKKIDKLLELGFVDSFRQFYPKKIGIYTWWTHWANARARNVGWRIDYCLVSRALSPRLKNAYIWPKVMGSDHCPVGFDIKG